MKKLSIILGVIIIIGGIATGVIMTKVKQFEKYLDQIEIVDVDLSKISNGLYTGISDAGVIKVKVEVEIQDHKIINIRLLEHKNGKGEKAEVIINDIVEEQKITVDTISGATSSSLVIQDAIQKALR